MERALALILLLSSCLALAGSRTHTRSGHRGRSPRTPEFSILISKANEQAALGNYASARDIYESGLQRSATNASRAAMLLGIGNCDAATHQYASALRAYSDAAQYSRTVGDDETLVRVAASRASVYRRMGNQSAAVEVMRQVEPLLNPGRHALVLLQAAAVLRDLDWDRSLQLFRASIDSSKVAGDRHAEATAWNHLGYAWMIQGDLPKAEYALNEAFRIRKSLGNRQLQASYYYLTILKRSQRDLTSGANLAHAALAQRDRQVPEPLLYFELATVQRLAGKLVPALSSYDLAVQAAREWRLQFVPSEDFRVSAEVGLQQIYADYIHATMALQEQTGDARLVRRALELAEETRSLFFQEKLASDRGRPPEYWQALAQFRRVLTESLGKENGADEQKIAGLRLALADIEARTGGEVSISNNSHQINERTSLSFPLSGLQRRLSRSEALISFHTGAAESYRWAVTSDHIEVQRLPDRTQITAAVQAFRRAVESRGEEAGKQGAQLFQILFGGLSRRALDRSAWILSLDGPLFGLPFAALMEPAGSSNRYLIERRSLRVVPGLSVMHSLSEDHSFSDKFVGIGDAIYNTADRRWKGEARPSANEQLLARIPGSAREIRNAAAAWQIDPSPVLLTGTAVNDEEIHQALQRRPAVLHFATHVVQHSSSRDQVLIALGLQRDGEAGYLGPAEIVAKRRPVGLVTLSGCGSGQGSALPGLGLFGITRAWLLSGARTVMATYWPIIDDDGELTRSFYENLHQRRNRLSAPQVAEAMREAQLIMLRSQGPKAHPAYWAAFFVLGKE